MAKAKKATKKKATKKKTTKPAKPGQVETPPIINNEFAEAVQQAETRGGVREGAGRTPGLTAEKAKVKNLPKLSAAPIRQGGQALFDLWASAAKIEELALSEDEAELLGLPITQLAEYYFPGMIPEIAGSWIMLIFAVTRIAKPRFALVAQARKERAEKTVQAKPAEVTGKLKHFKNSNGALHAITPGEECEFTNESARVTCPVCIDILNKASQN